MKSNQDISAVKEINLITSSCGNVSEANDLLEKGWILLEANIALSGQSYLLGRIGESA